MNFEDNFIEAKLGWLVDPVSKLRMNTSGHKESGHYDAMLHMGYDPEIRADRLTVPPSAESRARCLANPSMIHLADESLIFSSDQYTSITRIPFEWEKPNDVLRFKIQNNKYNFELKSDVFRVEKTPIASAHPKETLLYMVQSLARMHMIRDFVITERFPEIERIEVCVKAEVAYGFFGLSEKRYPEVEPGWVCIASREADQ